MTRDAYHDVPIYDLSPLNGERVLADTLDFGTIGAKVAWLELVARDAARGARPVAAVARQITKGIEDPWARLAALHDWRVANIGYSYEEAEAFEFPRLTLAAGVGDCEDHATLGAAMALAVGCDFRFRLVGRDPDDPAHLTLLVAPPGAPDIARCDWGPLYSYPEEIPGWAWSETSFPAYFGEHPLLGAVRCGVVEDPNRPDFDEEDVRP